jgi:thiosulfate dehydrogenase (quinone) large subunit
MEGLNKLVERWLIMVEKVITERKSQMVTDPLIARFLFADKRSAPIWLAVRLWIGFAWLASGWSKAKLWDFENGTWLVGGGSSLKGYWERATTVAPGGRGAVVTYDWYYDFLKFMTDNQWYTWFAWVIVLGEIAVGLGLITGTLTGVAAFFGTLLNFNFLLAGTVSTNPVMFGATIFLVLAWKNAGWWGLDRFVLPALGTPWQAGTLFKGKKGTDDTSTTNPPDKLAAV